MHNLVANRAEWRKSCHDKFNHSKLEKAKVKPQNEGNKNLEDRRYSKSQKSNSQICIFCEMGGELQEVSTFGVDRHIRVMAEELEDSTLLARLAAGDMIAIEAKYHKWLPVAAKESLQSSADKVTKENTTD